MNSKEKMLELIKKKQGGGKAKQLETPKNDRKNMRKGPKIFNKQFKVKISDGDSPNALLMMAVADLSFAVENASEEVKAICSHVVPSNDEHGVAYVLNNMNLF